MNCKNHPDRKAEYICASCKVPLCSDCAEEVSPGVYNCFQCAMFHSVADVGSDLLNKYDASVQKKKKLKKRWGPFQFFIFIASILILVMWGVIIFGGQPAPQRTASFLKNDRVFLFMVNGALTRYAHYEKNKYPQMLSELVPKYLALQDSDLIYLEKLLYKTDLKIGYRLSMANPKEGDFNPVLTPGGIESASKAAGDHL